ncbi:MAG TPA: hypothetical protein VLF60_03090 [Candidatus Saccharimonadales bacterium]|nr:hypothetical protein [Candidatus Saccharimonadales bacterium]
MGELNNIVIVTGVSASGKDYLLDHALSDQSAETQPTSLFPFGTMIHQRMKNYYPGKYDDPHGLQRAPTEALKEVASGLVEEIVAAEGLRIVNTHVAYLQGESVVIDPFAGIKMRPRDYVVVTADPAEIAKRRITDTRKNRIREETSAIEIHQRIGLAAVNAIADVIGSRVTVINNNPGPLAANLALMRTALHGIDTAPAQDGF